MSKSKLLNWSFSLSLTCSGLISRFSLNPWTSNHDTWKWIWIYGLLLPQYQAPALIGPVKDDLTWKGLKRPGKYQMPVGFGYLNLSPQKNIKVNEIRVIFVCFRDRCLCVHKLQACIMMKSLKKGPFSTVLQNILFQISILKIFPSLSLILKWNCPVFHNSYVLPTSSNKWKFMFKDRFYKYYSKKNRNFALVTVQIILKTRASLLLNNR